MEKPATTASKARLLLNAEPFGFGPTAAIAECFLHLRPLFQTIGYLGKGHTLDLQKPLPYDRIHDLEREENPEAVFADYDIFFTALDFEMAGKALAHGLTVIIYDPLTWYWKTIPAVVRDVDLYIAQNFFGVEERLKSAEFAAAKRAATRWVCTTSASISTASRLWLRAKSWADTSSLSLKLLKISPISVSSLMSTFSSVASNCCSPGCAGWAAGC